ncbi:Gfo/Idh/MocA family oxidoreductase [Ruminococcaceae bacterium OttesenSCG-928-D13]|nr:Gfo/Idh/MocA family oxidoreductase [Ruminococcaceae bacterium OttesenSCG-928-D13]
MGRRSNVETKMKLGILGFGFMGHTHAETVKRFEDIELVAVCDNDPRQLEDVRGAPFKIYTEADDIIADPDINVLLIATPNQLHRDMVLKAAAAKKHVLCEKPAAMSLEEFDDMVRACEENGVLFTVHQQRRFDPDFCMAKAVFEQGLVGKPYVIKSQLYGVNGFMHDWHVQPEYGGGMLYDWGVHLLDQMLYMVPGKVKTVFADLRNVINDVVDDYFRIQLLFENGLTAEIELGTYYLTPDRCWFMGGDTGSMVIRGFGQQGSIVRTRHLLENVPGKITMSASGPTRSFGPPEPGLLYEEPLPEVSVSHDMFFENFLRVLNGKEAFVVQPAQVRRVLALMDVVRQSAAEGGSIAFE